MLLFQPCLVFPVTVDAGEQFMWYLRACFSPAAGETERKKGGAFKTLQRDRDMYPGLLRFCHSILVSIGKTCV